MKSLNQVHGLTLLNNKVLIKPDFIKTSSDADIRKITLPSGAEVFVDLQFEANKHRPVTGHVVAMCKELDCHISTGFEWTTTNELQIGDWVNYHFHVAEDCLKYENGLYEHEGQVYFLADYFEIFVARRGGKIIPVNGYILCEPVTRTQKLKIPGQHEHSRETMKVKYVGTCNTAYYNSAYTKEYDNISEGDIIIPDVATDIPLEYEFNSTFKEKLFRLQRRNVVGFCKKTTIE